MTQHIDQPESEIKSELKEGLSISTSKYIVAIAAFLLMLVIWISKSNEVASIKQEAAKENQVLRGRATRQVVQSHEEHLKLLAKPFGWAIRAEIAQNNLPQIRLYMNEMVEKTNFEHIAVVDINGIIIASTERRQEGKHFSTIGESKDLVGSQVSLKNEGNRKLIMRSPIMAAKGRIGTLIIRYKIQPFEVK